MSPSLFKPFHSFSDAKARLKGSRIKGSRRAERRKAFFPLSAWTFNHCEVTLSLCCYRGLTISRSQSSSLFYLGLRLKGRGLTCCLDVHLLPRSSPLPQRSFPTATVADFVERNEPFENTVRRIQCTDRKTEHTGTDNRYSVSKSSVASKVKSLISVL